jgi:predicted nucleic acid-binding protein
MYLLDSSAWLVHMFDEPGVDQINQMFDESSAQISISVLSIPEIAAKLKSLGQDARWPEVWQNYKLLFNKVVPVDLEIAQKAVDLRSTASQRLPTVDALIVATALVHKLTVVHRDVHIGAIPGSLLRQIQLPDK